MLENRVFGAHKFQEEGRRKKEEGRRKKEEGRRKKEEGRRKKEEAIGVNKRVKCSLLFDD
ncbi:MAG: hypothetical protein EAZ79_17355 [Oscillatoriales cyanobacterium]|nr:MAG: hypothetical protein EAZ79_17355 [Oscillatoriales cyanobacterium]